MKLKTSLPLLVSLLILASPASAFDPAAGKELAD